MMNNGKKPLKPQSDDLLLQVMKSKGKAGNEAQQEKMQAVLAKLAEQNPALVAEIIQKWLTEEKDCFED